MVGTSAIGLFTPFLEITKPPFFAAFLGLFTISFYGMNDIADVEERVARDLDVDFDEEDNEIVNEGSSSSGSNSKH